MRYVYKIAEGERCAVPVAYSWKMKKILINKIRIEKDIVEKLYNCCTLDYSAIIPKMPKLRIEVTASDMDNTITKIIMAMAETYKLYVDWTG